MSASDSQPNKRRRTINEDDDSDEEAVWTPQGDPFAAVYVPPPIAVDPIQNQLPDGGPVVQVDDAQQEEEEKVRDEGDVADAAFRQQCADMLGDDDRTTEQVALLLHVLKQRNIRPDKVKVTSSGGRTVTVIPEDEPFVIQHFLEEVRYQRVKAFGTACADAPPVETVSFGSYQVPAFQAGDGIAGMLGSFDAQRCLLLEKVMPLNGLCGGGGGGQPRQGQDQEDYVAFIGANADKIVYDINKAVHGLASLDLSQGDVSLDNIGIKDGRFVLFDFDLCGAARTESDLNSLKRSLAHAGTQRDFPDLSDFDGEAEELAPLEAAPIVPPAQR